MNAMKKILIIKGCFISKVFLIFGLLTNISQITYSQEIDREFRPDLGFYGGLSIPLGDFKSKTLSDWDDDCGCANTNGSVSVKWRIRIINNFYASTGIGRYWNSYDPEPIGHLLGTTFDSPISVESDSWKSLIMPIGLGYSFYLFAKGNTQWSFAIEAGGLMNDLTTYHYRIYMPDASFRYPLLQKSVSDFGVGYFSGASIKCILFDVIAIRLTSDYFATHHHIKDADRRYNGGDLIARNYKQKVEILSIQLGAAIDF